LAKAAFELKSTKRQVFELPPSHLAKGLRIEACAGGGDLQDGDWRSDFGNRAQATVFRQALLNYELHQPCR